MKKSIVKYKTNIHKIPYSKTSINKISVDLSLPGQKMVFAKNKSDSINKETVDGSCVDAQTLAFNQDSLNNSKINFSKNQSLNKLDNKLLVFTSSLKYSLNSLNKRNKSSNFSKNIQTKTEEECSENISSSDDNIISLGGYNQYNEEDEETNKIDYRYYPKIPEIETDKDNNPYYWLATYDKLMKKSKLVKILNYYSDSLSHRDTEIFIIEDANSDYIEEETKERMKKMNAKYNFKEKTMIIPGYEIYFVKKHGKPFIRQRKGGKLFIKLYLLNLEQINQIYSYINRLEYKKYINNLNSFNERNSFKIINNSNKSIYNYSTIFCLGTFMNTNIYAFSHNPHNNLESENETYNINDLPSANKLAKIIKALMINFPDFSKQYFIDYLMKPKELNIESESHFGEILNQKMGEINALIMSKNKRDYMSNINNANNIIKKTIRGIPTFSPSCLNSPFSFNSNNQTPYNFTTLNLLDKNSTNNYNNNSNKNSQVNCSDFLSNIKNELDGLSKESKLNNNKINDFEYKKTNTKPLNKIKLSSTTYTRNNKNIFSSINYKSSNQTFYNLKQNSICKTISLQNNSKKSLTRNNSNTFIYYQKTKNIKTNDNSFKNRKQKNIENSSKNKENKENNSSALNKNLISEYSTDNKINKINSMNKIINQTDSRKYFKVTRNKNNVISPYFTNSITNTNSINKETHTQNNKHSKIKKPIRVLSSIRKVISQKINNISEGSSSFLKFNKINSNSSFKEIASKRYFNDNNICKGINTSKYNKIVCKTNNNSKNKKSDYITPLKKKYFYYYH